MAATIFLVAACSSSTWGTQRQGEEAPQAAKAVPSRAQVKGLSIKVSADESGLITLHAKNSSLTDIAAELGRLLKIPVSLSPVMQKRRVTIKLDGLSLAAVLPLLAPRAYIDYVVEGGSTSAPRPVAIYLYAFNEQLPVSSLALKDAAQTVIIEGDTESIGEASAQQSRSGVEKKLRLSLEHNQLSIFASKQPLSAVLYEISSKFGIPLDVQYDSGELIDVDYKGPSLEDAVRTSLPATVRLYSRTDLTTLESKPIFIALVSPSKTPDVQN